MKTNEEMKEWLQLEIAKLRTYAENAGNDFEVANSCSAEADAFQKVLDKIEQLEDPHLASAQELYKLWCEASGADRYPWGTIPASTQQGWLGLAEKLDNGLKEAKDLKAKRLQIEGVGMAINTINALNWGTGVRYDHMSEAKVSLHVLKEKLEREDA